LSSSEISDTKLKALTILNEMMYSERVVAAVRSTSGAREALTTLQKAGHSGVSDENARMLATEVYRACFWDMHNRSSTLSKGGFPKMSFEMFASGLTNMTNVCRLAGQKVEKTWQKPEVQAVLHGAEKQTTRTVMSLERTAMNASEAVHTMSRDFVRQFSGQTKPGSPPSTETGVAGGGVAGGFAEGVTSASNWMRRFGVGGTVSVASTSPSTTPIQMAQNNLDLHAGNINAEEWQLQWALDASLAGEIQKRASNDSNDVPARLHLNSMKTFDKP